MITVKISKGIPYATPTGIKPAFIFQISMDEIEELRKFQQLLNRSLNCAPEFG